MRLLWSERYLWIHVAGFAALPVALEGCLLTLGIGDPFLPSWLEWSLIATLGIGPIVWMQWQRPFYIFSLLVVALKPQQLTTDQRRILSQFKARETRLGAAAAAILAAAILWQLYKIAPIASGLLPLPQWRSVGLVLAAVTFLASNLFLQVPVSVLRILFLSDAKFLATEPYPAELVKQGLTILGWQVNQILPSLELEESTPSSVTPERET
jgi:hypothetical protein